MNASLPSSFWSLDDRMTVVLFAGMGGGCDGLEDAGFHVHLAVNHDPLAIAVHETRHPHTTHLRCDVFEVDPKKATKGRRVRNLHASPDCTHFSVAKGSKPVSKRRRSLAWVIPRWCGTVRPEVVTLENVREITTWGPLIAKRDKATGRVLRIDGSVAAKGERVPVAEQWLIPDPRHKGRIWRAWLKHMHSLGYSFEFKNLCCADYGVPTIRTRLFGVGRADGGEIAWPDRTHAPRKDAKHLGLKPWVGAHTIIDWSLPVRSIFGRKKPLAEATLRRIARGVMRYVVDAADPFIVPICQTGSTTPGRSVADPLATVTTAKGGELALVAANLVRTDQASAAGRNGIHDVREPINTLHTAGGMPVAAVSLAAAGGRAAQTELRDITAPLNTTSTKEDRLLVAATLVQTGYGERAGQTPRVKDIGNPAGTQVAGGGKEALVAAFLAQHNNDSRRIGGVNPGREAAEPMSTITVAAAQQGVVAATLGRLRGTDVEGQRIDHPLPTQTCGGGHEMLILPFLQTYYGSGANSHDARNPLHTVTVNDRHGLVTVEVNGQTMVITDICMRMLDPLEGARAHGFDPASLQHEIEVTDGRGRKVRRKPNKTEIGHLVGNSVPPRMVQLLAEANCRRELMVAAE
ncbi:modification methylase [Devosia sp. H5989]|nr:modification methylase [Devosia sp. H5989]